MRRWTMRGLLQRVRWHEQEFRAAVDDEIRAMVRRRLATSSPFPPPAEVSSGLRELLDASTAKEAKRIIRTLAVTQKDLAALVFNAHVFGYEHERFGYEKIPAQHRLTDADRRAFFFERAQKPDLAAKAMRKIDGVFAERRVYTAHVFANEARWHVFSFTYDDAQLGRRGHWAEGAHLHYTSSVLEPRRALDAVIADLRTPESEVHGHHVRFLFDEERRRGRGSRGASST